MIYWAPLFHFYQPPTQTRSVLMKICNEAYHPLIEVLKEYPHAKATVNINGVLTEMLYECGHNDIIAGLKKLAEDGQIEFVDSGKYHPILPLISAEEMERQIRRNYMTNRYFFGEAYVPRGFFPPEMCYAKDIVGPILASRHDWVIVSGIACPVAWPMNVIHEIAHDHEEQKLAVFFRDDILSNKISFRSIDGKGFVEHLAELHKGEDNLYVITAMDAETFGHHIKGWEKLFLADVYDRLGKVEMDYKPEPPQVPLANQHRKLLEFQRGGDIIEIVTISKLLDIFPRGSRIEPIPSSWSTTVDDIKARNYYPLWKDKDNIIHQLQWEHLSIATEVVHKAQEVADNPSSRHFAVIARSLLSQAFHSDQFWWASKRPMWDINLVYLGLNLQREVLLNGYKAISLSNISPQAKREYYYKVVASRHLFDEITDRLYLD